jgi:chitinase
VAGAGTASGTLVQAYTCNATSAQSWALSTPGSGGGGPTGDVFAPFEYVGDLGDANQIPGIVSASGAKAVILAFVDPDNGGCNLIWPGASGPIPTDTVGSTSMATAISQMQAAGVTVAISQGGAGGQEAAAYCSSASATQAVYQQLITRYNVKWLDFDVEYGETSGQSVRRAQALAALQAAYPGLVVSYTLPLGGGGLNGGSGGGTQDLTDAKNAGLNLTIVNGMAMDFGGTNTNQPALSESGAAGLESQIKSAGLSSTVGLTFLPGTSDDSPPNYFTIANAQTMLSWAQSNTYVTLLSFWELNRDNGGCPGSTSDQDTCSGVSQSNYQFSSIFKAF